MKPRTHWNKEFADSFSQIKLVSWCKTTTQHSQAQWGGRKLRCCICADGRTVSILAEDDKKVGSKNTHCDKTNPLVSNLVHSLHSWAVTVSTDCKTPVWFGCGATCACTAFILDFKKLPRLTHATAFSVYMSSLCRHWFNSRAGWHLCFFTRMSDSFQ